MTIDETAVGFIIVRGKNRDVYFSFFVDSDSSSWTEYAPGARIYETREKAESDLTELRDRARNRRAMRAK